MTDTQEKPQKVWTLKKKSATNPKKLLKPTRGRRHLTHTEKAHICEIYRSGTASYADLAKKYRCNPQTIAKVIKENNVTKGEASDLVKAKVEEELQKQLADEAGIIATRIKETKEEHYKMATGLAKLLWKTIADAKRDPKTGGRITNAVANEIKTYKAAAETLRITRAERYVVLNITEKEKEELENRQDFPELKIQELDAETIQKMNEAQRLQMDDIGEMWDDDLPSYDDKVMEGEDSEDPVEEDI